MGCSLVVNLGNEWKLRTESGQYKRASRTSGWCGGVEECESDRLHGGSNLRGLVVPDYNKFSGCDSRRNWNTCDASSRQGVKVKSMFELRVVIKDQAFSDKHNFRRIWYTVIIQRSYKLKSARHYSHQASTWPSHLLPCCECEGEGQA